MNNNWNMPSGVSTNDIPGNGPEHPPEYECPYCTKRHIETTHYSRILCCGEIGDCVAVCPECDSGETHRRKFSETYSHPEGECWQCDACGHNWGCE